MMVADADAGSSGARLHVEQDLPIVTKLHSVLPRKEIPSLLIRHRFCLQRWGVKGCLGSINNVGAF